MHVTALSLTRVAGTAWFPKAHDVPSPTRSPITVTLVPPGAGPPKGVCPEIEAESLSALAASWAARLVCAIARAHRRSSAIVDDIPTSIYVRSRCHSRRHRQPTASSTATARVVSQSHTRAFRPVPLYRIESHSVINREKNVRRVLEPRGGRTFVTQPIYAFHAPAVSLPWRVWSCFLLRRSEFRNHEALWQSGWA